MSKINMFRHSCKMHLMMKKWISCIWKKWYKHRSYIHSIQFNYISCSNLKTSAKLPIYQQFNKNFVFASYCFRQNSDLQSQDSFWFRKNYINVMWKLSLLSSHGCIKRWRHHMGFLLSLAAPLPASKLSSHPDCIIPSAGKYII